LQRWFQKDLRNFEVLSIFDLLMRYIREGRIRLDPRRHTSLTTFNDACNYGRKSLKTFGHGYFDEARQITRLCAPNFVEMYPNREGNYCCGGGGGSWAMPFKEERVFYGRLKARQIKNCKAKLVIASCHNCRDQIMKSLRKEYDLDIEVKYLWELVAESLVLPGRESAGARS